jgi:hypothetical protein
VSPHLNREPADVGAFNVCVNAQTDISAWSNLPTIQTPARFCCGGAYACARPRNKTGCCGPKLRANRSMAKGMSLAVCDSTPKVNGD